MHLSNLIFNLCDWLDCCCLHRIWHVACKNDVPLHMSAHFSNYISWHCTINAIHTYELPGKGRNTYRNTISFSQQDMPYYEWKMIHPKKKKRCVKEKTSQVNMNVIFFPTKRRKYTKCESRAGTLRHVNQLSTWLTLGKQQCTSK